VRECMPILNYSSERLRTVAHWRTVTGVFACTTLLLTAYMSLTNMFFYWPIAALGSILLLIGVLRYRLVGGKGYSCAIAGCVILWFYHLPFIYALLIAHWDAILSSTSDVRDFLDLSAWIASPLSLATTTALLCHRRKFLGWVNKTGQL